MAACVATWSFGLQAVLHAQACIEDGMNCIDVLESAINVVEDDPTTGPYYVGRGCYPNHNGIVQLDAALMRGSDYSFGAVAALEQYAKPISVAKCVLEHSSLNMLVGSGATAFALNQGFTMEDNQKLLSDTTSKAYEEYRYRNVHPPQTGHDTLSVLCLDKYGHLAAGISTSGPPFKAPGRVGDSPLPGCGLYADDKAGAAAASGDGEYIMRFCPSFQIVQLMREGMKAQEACNTTVERMLRQSGQQFEVAVIALDTEGSIGAASTVTVWKDFKDQKSYSGFPYAHWSLKHGPPSISVQAASILAE